MLGKSILGAVCRAALGMLWGLITFGAFSDAPSVNDAPSALHATNERPAARSPARTAQR